MMWGVRVAGRESGWKPLLLCRETGDVGWAGGGSMSRGGLQRQMPVTAWRLRRNMDIMDTMDDNICLPAVHTVHIVHIVHTVHRS